jgi:hypothetical protein
MTMAQNGHIDMPVLSMSDEDFEQWRHVQDDVADRVAAILMESPLAHIVYPVLGKIGMNDAEITEDLFDVEPEELERDPEYRRLANVMREYYADTSLFPKTPEEIATIKRGCEVFDLHVGDGLFILTLRSLLKQYAASRATNVLTSTRLIVDYPHRRIVETLQFVADVMDEDGMDEGGYTMRSIQNLRLVHAMVRYRIRRKQNNPSVRDRSIALEWDDSWGAPINQQDMIFAIHTFSVEVIDGLLAHGTKLTKQMIDDYYFTWHLYGRALGVVDELNPKTYEEGKAVQERIYSKEFKPNKNALELTPPLIDFSQRLLPFSPSKTHIYAMIKKFNDKKDYKPIFEDILGLPISKAHLGWLGFYFVLDEITHFMRWVGTLFTPKNKEAEHEHRLAHRNKNMMQALVNIEKTWSGKHFRIADGFGDSASKIDAKRIKTQPTFMERLAHFVS